MGCSQSTQVIQQKRRISIEVTEKIEIEQKQSIIKKTIKQIPERGQCFLIGSISQKQQVFAHVKLQTMSINKMSIPSGGFVCNNFSSMLQIETGIYFISGGINYDLTQISDAAYFYYSQNHRVNSVAKMKQSRYTHSSLYFPQKNAIYIIGGRFYGDDAQAILSNCEKYSIDLKQWICLPNMNVKRCTCFTFTWNRNIYVFGGYTGPYQRSTIIEYLSPDQNQWKLLNIQLNRGLEGAILLPTNDNEVTIFGGLANSGATYSVITINLKQKSIRSKKRLLQKRSLSKSYYKSGKVYFFGGDNNFTCQIYDITKQTSTLIKKQFPFSIEEFDNFGFSTSSVHVPFNQIEIPLNVKNQTDQIVYIFGTTQQPFLCQLNISIPEAIFKNVPLCLKLYAHQGGVFINSKVLILFGGIEDDSLSVINSDTYLYDLRKNYVKNIAKMNQNRYAFTYQKIKNNLNQVEFIYCFGGATSNIDGKLVYLNACQKFSVKQHKWDLISPLPQKLISSMSLVYKDNIFVLGGTNERNQKSQNIHMYNIKQNQWLTLETRILFGIEAGSISKINQNQFYLFGGLLQNGQTDGIWRLYFTQNIKDNKKQTACVIHQKGRMNEKKSQHKIYKPTNQDFYVIFGGDKDPLTFYKYNLEQQNSDIFLNLKQMFMNLLQNLNNKNLKGYLILGQSQT